MPRLPKVKTVTVCLKKLRIDPIIRVYDAEGNVTGTHEHAGDFKE